MAHPEKQVHEEEDVISALGQVITEGNDLERCLAAKALGRIGGKGSADVLNSALRDIDEDVRIDVAEAIARLSLKGSIPKLVENLREDPSVDGKLACIDALKILRAGEATPWLRKLTLGPCQEEVSWDEQELAESEFDEWLEVQRTAIEALGHIGASEAIADIRTAMNDEFGQDLLLTGLKAFGQMGEAGTAELAKYLKSRSARHRQVAVSVLSQNSAPLTDDMIGNLLKDPEPDIRAIGVTFCRSDDPRLEQLCGDPSESVRAVVCARLARANPSRLAQLLNDPSDTVQLEVLKTCRDRSEKPDAAALNRIAEFLDCESNELVCLAIEILGRFDPDTETIGAIEKKALSRSANMSVRRTAIKVIAECAPDTVLDALTKIIPDPLRPIRLASLAALAEIARNESSGHREGAQNLLLGILAGRIVPISVKQKEREEKNPQTHSSQVDSNEPERHGAHAAKEDEVGQRNRIRIDREGNIVEDNGASASGRNDLKREPTARDKTEQTDPDEETAADAFPQSTLDALQNESSSLIEEAAPGDIQLTSEDLDFLELAQSYRGKKVLSPDKGVPVHQDVRVMCARLLGESADITTVQALVKVLEEQNDELRVAAAMSLSRVINDDFKVDDPFRQSIIRHIADKNSELRLWLVRLCSKLADPSLADVLRDRLGDDDPNIRGEAILGLSRIENSFKASDYLDDAQMVVRHSAAEAISQRQGHDAWPTIVDYAFKNGGEDRWHAAKLLKSADIAAPTEQLIHILRSDKNGLNRRVAIEVLTELHAQSL